MILNLNKLKHRLLLIDFILLLVSWGFPLFLFGNNVQYVNHYFVLFVPLIMQIVLFAILGNYDDRLGAKLLSRRRLAINGIISFIFIFFIFKFFSLVVFQSFYIRVRYYLLIVYPIQFLLYYLTKTLLVRNTNVTSAQEVCVIGGEKDLERLKNWFSDNHVGNRDFVLKTLFDANEGTITNLSTKSVQAIEKNTKLFQILSEHDLVVYFTTQILDTREARNLLRFGSGTGSFFDFATFCGLIRETYPVDFIDTEWYVRKSSNLWVKISLYLRFRRLFDFISCLLLLVVTFPLWLFATFAILISSPGPIFYTQERIGRMGSKFKILKFRSMKIDAEKAGPQFAQNDDHRVTTIGRFLRRTRIDELPQIINVLKGEMSLIGPRPEREHFENMLNKDLPLLQLRNFIAPGITGLAQVNSDYANDLNSYKKKLGYDLYYILNLSPLLDLSILLRTVRTVLFRRGS